MDQKLQILLNTLMTIETKGENTKIMAECLKYTQQLINEIKINSSTTDSPSAEVTR